MLFDFLVLNAPAKGEIRGSWAGEGDRLGMGRIKKPTETGPAAFCTSDHLWGHWSLDSSDVSQLSPHSCPLGSDSCRLPPGLQSQTPGDPRGPHPLPFCSLFQTPGDRPPTPLRHSALSSSPCCIPSQPSLTPYYLLKKTAWRGPAHYSSFLWAARPFLLPCSLFTLFRYLGA